MHPARGILRVGLTVAAALLAVAASGPPRAAQAGTSVGKLAFSRCTLDPGLRFCASDIYVMSADGSGLRRLTHGRRALQQDVDPAWSPDGTKLAFVRDTTTPSTDLRDPDVYDVYVVDADGTNERLLVSNGQTPSWSPDGRRIAFSRNGIMVVAADGRGLHRLTHKGGDPDWSPDGTKIAYMGFHINHTQLRVMNVDGTGDHVLYDHRAYSPVWAPDGRRIAFIDWSGMRLVDPSGQNLELVKPGEVYTPAWSPDGRRIAYAVWDDGLYVMRRDGSDPQKVPRTGKRDSEPDWSAGG